MNECFFRPHHLGIAVADLEQSTALFQALGWTVDSEITEDVDRNVRIIFLCRPDHDERLELISPLNEKSPVSATLKTMKNVATPYHICYETSDLEAGIAALKGLRFAQVNPPKAAVAFSGRRVAFLLKKETGLIELVEKEKQSCEDIYSQNVQVEREREVK